MIKYVIIAVGIPDVGELMIASFPIDGSLNTIAEKRWYIKHFTFTFLT
jgi:hypothetical protein